MMNRKKLLQSKRKGSAIALMMVALVVLLVTGVGLLSMGLRSRVFALRTASEIAARCAADAGLTKAIFEMNQNLKVIPWSDSNLPQVTNETLANCDALFSYTIAGSDSGGYTVESIGSYGQAERKVRSTLRLRGLFDSAILVEETITLKMGTIVDGYDSSNPDPLDVPVQIATTSAEPGSIDLGGATVDGEALVGVSGYFPVVSPPALPDMGADLYAKSTTLTIGPEQSGKYTGVEILMGAVPGILEIDGGDVVLYVTGSIYLGQSCEMRIKAGSTLTLYLEGDLSAGNSSGVNNETQDPAAFVLYGTGEDQTFELKAKTEWYGAIYAPNADVTIKAGSTIAGAFVCSNFSSTGGSLILYDEALRDVTTTDVGVLFVVDRWFE
jgi:hypothetical protein